MWLTDKSGSYNLDSACAVVPSAPDADKKVVAVVHTNGGHFNTATDYAEVVKLVGGKPAAPAEPAK